MPASPIRRLVPFAEAAKARGIQVHHLNIGQPDLPTPPEFFAAIQAADIKVLDYSHSAGIARYRDALAQYYDRFEMNLTPDQILVTTGGSEALQFAFAVCFNPGDEVIVPEPYYANYSAFALQYGVRVRPITTPIETGYGLPSPDVFAQYIGPNTRAILLCNPSNPTGKLYSSADIQALAQLALSHDLWLMADEVYKEFCYGDAPFTSLHSLPELSQHAVVVDSVSKRYSACGARIGALLCKNDAVLAASLKLAQARLSPPTLGQVGCEALCQLPDSYYAGVRLQYIARRDQVLDALAEMPGVVCPKPEGAFYVMPKLPINDSDVFCRWLLEHFEYQGQTVMLAPGTGFYATPGLGRQEVRLAYVLEREPLGQALACLKQALAVYPGKV